MILTSVMCRPFGCKPPCEEAKDGDAGELQPSNVTVKDQIPWSHQHCSPTFGSQLPSPDVRIDEWHRAVADQLEQRSRQWIEVEGAYYSGQWLGNTWHGHGRLERTGVGSYDGQFIKNTATGSGHFVKANGTVYDGQWKDDRAHGWGNLIHCDGSTYEGHWVADMKNGRGCECWTDGSMYEGDYYLGKKHGLGFYRACDGSQYEGDFVDELMHGAGRYDFVDGRIYTGQWELGRMSGEGRMDWPDGRIYEGQFKDDRRWGYGRFTWPDGRMFEGNWQNGKQHSAGVACTFVDRKGNRWAERWRNGFRMDRKKIVQTTAVDSNLLREACEGEVDAKEVAKSSTRRCGGHHHQPQIADIDGRPSVDADCKSNENSDGHSQRTSPSKESEISKDTGIFVAPIAEDEFGPSANHSHKVKIVWDFEPTEVLHERLTGLTRDPTREVTGTSPSSGESSNKYIASV